MYEYIGIIGRFKPLHNGGAAMLDAIAAETQELVIGIGSANKYGVRNPFTAQETEEMIRAYRAAPTRFAHIPDYGDATAWVDHIRGEFGDLDAIVSGNPYVTQLLSPHYHIIHPNSIIPAEKQSPIHSTHVRLAMAKDDGWETLVPPAVAQYLREHGLVERFQREFGAETIQSCATYIPETLEGEYLKTLERQL